MMALIEDRYFAIPDAELIARLTPRSQQAYSLVDVQVYRSPPGQMVAEMATDEGGEAELTVEDVTMIFTAAPYVRVTAAANPGRWPAALALVLLMVGLVGHVGWPAHRFWVRADEDTIEATGATPSWLLGGEKGY
jgi:hypothetical protein